MMLKTKRMVGSSGELVAGTSPTCQLISSYTFDLPAILIFHYILPLYIFCPHSWIIAILRCRPTLTLLGIALRGLRCCQVAAKF